MSGQNSARLPIFLMILIAILGGAAAWPGQLLISMHEGDTMHLMQIVLRMEMGQVPHLDFMTPIGAMAFAPIVWLVQTGMGVGNAFIWAQILLALVFVPLVWRSAATRLSPWLGMIFGLIIMVLILALIHGESHSAVSVSMHYNRWSWAAAFVVIMLAIQPPKVSNNGLIDGLIIGGLMMLMLMIKITYFAALSIPVVVALIATKQWKTLAVSLVSGILMIAAVSVFMGQDYWVAYLQDLLSVATSEVRPQPGLSLQSVIAAPAFAGGSILAVISVILLRQSQAMAAGLVLLLLLPGFFYVTYQNFGNDPQWLWILAVILMVSRPAADVVNSRGWNMRQAVNVAAAMALAFGLPSFLNLGFSAVRNLNEDLTDYVALVPAGGAHADIQTKQIRAMRVDIRRAGDGPGSGFEAYAEAADRDAFNMLGDEVFPYCQTELGTTAYIQAIALDLEQAGYTDGRSVFAADMFSWFWLHTDLAPVPNGAPWYYGGLPGYEQADMVIVPFCPMVYETQGKIMTAMNERGIDDLTEVRRTAMYVLYEKSGSK